MKNAEGIFPSLPARNEWGESLERGEADEKRPPLPALSSFWGGEGKGKRYFSEAISLA